MSAETALALLSMLAIVLLVHMMTMEVRTRSVVYGDHGHRYEANKRMKLYLAVWLVLRKGKR